MREERIAQAILNGLRGADPLESRDCLTRQLAPRRPRAANFKHRKDRHGQQRTSARIARLMCNQVGFDIANDAMQVMRGRLRRCRGRTIAGGSIEMMRNRRAEVIFGRRFSQRPPGPAVADAGLAR